MQMWHGPIVQQDTYFEEIPWYQMDAKKGS